MISNYLDHGVVGGVGACCHLLAIADDSVENFASSGASADGDAVSGFHHRFRFLCR